MKITAIGIAVIAALMGTPALAADMLVKAPPPVFAPAYDWTGFYLGAQGGVDWGSSVQFYTSGTTGRYGISGASGGVTGGYNWQFAPHWVGGIEGDFSFANITGTGATTATYNCGVICSTTVNGYGTVRARVGYVFGGGALLYATGGWAEAQITPNLNTFTQSSNLSGWAAGGGLEYRFAGNWSAKVEYLWLNFGSFNWTNVNVPTIIACAGINCSSDAKFNVVRIGLNYRFNWSAPVAAK